MVGVVVKSVAVVDTPRIHMVHHCRWAALRKLMDELMGTEWRAATGNSNCNQFERQHLRRQPWPMDIDINDNSGDDDEDDGRERTPLHHYLELRTAAETLPGPRPLTARHQVLGGNGANGVYLQFIPCL